MRRSPIILLLSLLATASFSSASYTQARDTIAQSLDARRLSPAESYVLKQVRKGDEADLASLSPDDEKKRVLNPDFLKRLLSGSIKVDQRHIIIKNGVLNETLDLRDQEIPYNVGLIHCTFKKDVLLSEAIFDRSLAIRQSLFYGQFNLDTSSVEDDLQADVGDESGNRTQFFGKVNLSTMSVKGSVSFAKAVFHGEVNFSGLHVGRGLYLQDASFESREVVGLDSMSMDDFILQRTTFAGPVEFSGTSPADTIDLRSAHFTGTKCLVNFENVRAYKVILTDVSFCPSDDLRTCVAPQLQGMAFERIEAGPKNEQVLGLIKKYEFSPEMYAKLESYFSKNGDRDNANEVFMEGKRQEYKNSTLKRWLLEYLVGYGRYPERALYPGAIIVILGYFIFRERGGMEPVEPKNAEKHYSPFWYSVDLFAPVIDLKVASNWVPKESRKFARNYVYVQRILGWILIPIGIAAWTGIIK
jgi:hypothetical protein